MRDPVRVSDLERSHMLVLSADRNARIPAPEDLVYRRGWLCPRLRGGKAVVLVNPKGECAWESLGEKRKK